MPWVVVQSARGLNGAHDRSGRTLCKAGRSGGADAGGAASGVAAAAAAQQDGWCRRSARRRAGRWQSQRQVPEPQAGGRGQRARQAAVGCTGVRQGTVRQRQRRCSRLGQQQQQQLGPGWQQRASSSSVEDSGGIRVGSCGQQAPAAARCSLQRPHGSIQVQQLALQQLRLRTSARP